MKKEYTDHKTSPRKTTKKYRPVGFSSRHNWIVWLIIFVIFCAMVYVLRSVLMPFVAGIVLGYLFDPLVRRLEKLKMSRTWATVLVFIMVVVIAVPALFCLLSHSRLYLSFFYRNANTKHNRLIE